MACVKEQQRVATRNTQHATRRVPHAAKLRRGRQTYATLWTVLACAAPLLSVSEKLASPNDRTCGGREICHLPAASAVALCGDTAPSGEWRETGAPGAAFDDSGTQTERVTCACVCVLALACTQREPPPPNAPLRSAGEMGMATTPEKVSSRQELSAAATQRQRD